MRGGLLTCLCGLILAAALTSPAAQAEILDRIVATVNGDIITMKEINQRLVPVLKHSKVKVEDPEKINEIRRKILERLIENKLALQEGKRLGVRIKETEVDDAIERIKQANRVTQEQFEAELIRRGSNIRTVREDLRVELIKSRLINMEIRSRIVVSAEQIDAYYREQGDKREFKPKVHVRNIVLAVPEGAPPSVAAQKQARAEEILAEIKDGLDFAEAAAKYSEGSNAKDGGDLGLVGWDEMAAGIKAALEKLEPGQTTPPVRTAIGIQ
ncbi:MAG: SurA N-terminal domain-containing protein, partial [Thermodesulfobacteriota bacterium]|nr:SurA N-terminal domain-containing protein [Thermodesulfobacteriota bacterium]